MKSVLEIPRTDNPKKFVIEMKAYSEDTWSCNMSYELKFCGLSEYVRLKKVRLLIKSTDWSK